MRFLLIIFFLLVGCSKPKTVLICGDHKCINKAEADQYFKEFLTIEVKVIDNKNEKIFNLVQVNLNDNKSTKKINITNKKNNKKIKNLTGKELIKKKEEVKNKKKLAKLKNKNIKKNLPNQITTNKEKNIRSNTNKNTSQTKEKIKPKSNLITEDVCKIVKKCDIDEITKYLKNQGDAKEFPDLTNTN